MDAVEIARQTAAQLHLEAVARGLDPWQAYDFVVAEANHHNYTVEDMLPGAAMLDGGRAKLLPSEELILHERKGTPFEQALLIAHEIGHAMLGDADDSTPAKDIDFARSAERSPVGEERVVDYGRKQRREVQMDLFARELLLPRPVVRRLHLQDGLTASDIAEKLKAPFDVVAQQLLDALLLPDMQITSEEARREHPLNACQKKAVDHRGRAFLLGAGPGTGKTQTLVARVEGLLDEGVDPRSILLLTFSNRAAGEMAERIGQKRQEAAAALWVGTFHAFGLDLVRRFHAELGLASDPRMIDRTEAVELLEEEFPRLGLVHYQDLYDPTQVIYDLLAAISRAKDEVIGPQEYERLGEDMLRKASSHEEVESAKKVLEVARVYATYEALKRQRNLVDFGDLVWLPVKLLESDEKIRQHLASTYSHVLVDEYQDVNRSSVRLLTALCGSGDNLWVVGDAKQSIYRFRGASSFNVSRFGKKDFPLGIADRLTDNYRSLKPIVDAYSEFAKGMKVGGVDSVLEPVRKEPGEPPELFVATGADEQTVALADSIQAMKEAGFRYSDQAVLCTGNDKLSDLGQDLERLGIPVLFLGSLFERPEVKDLLSLLSLLIDPRAMGLVRVACLSQFDMSLSDVAAVLTYLRQVDLQPLAFIDAPDIPGLSADGSSALKRLRVVFDGFSSDARPWDVASTILLDRTRLAADICGASSVNSRAQGIAIWQFMNFIRTQPAGAGLPISRLLDRIRRLLRLGDDRDLRQLPAAARGIDAVRLMTIHGSKGLEFDVVHVPGLNEDTLPGYRKPAPACLPPEGMIEGATGPTEKVLDETRSEEQECLFYVAQSRARDRLFLYAASMNRGGKPRKLSENFLQRMGQGLKRQSVNPSRALPPAPASADVPMSFTGGMRFDAHQVELYERCPRRFFYTHVLQTGGRRKTTPFMQMHEAVRNVLKEIVSAVDGGDGVALGSKVEEALTAEGLATHGYYSHYRDFALAMILYFAQGRENCTPEKPTALRVAYGEEEILVTPDDVLITLDGTKILRRIMTGHGRKDDEKTIGAAAFLTAATEAFPGAHVELVYLADQETRPVTLKPNELRTRKEHMLGHLGQIRAGHFPQKASSRTCPNCPAFFICGPVPHGSFVPAFRVPSAPDEDKG
ncbi:ATP-dependent helicase [Burkholderia pseudomallei]|uniref:ATP-dependent helicase n=1 Tax=Burkholderia pseudomallei TaxID=28450 RepID=UPI001AD7B353|nr:ATP-dependent helicase [Burkholderia pseudomallei]MBO7832533.1 UvrD-helicase domain-containing protein [Burkholderia pseudomallei]MBO7850980.1 UvrD-helicase domain-containing protein [Burkholderia pseudomallei]